MGIKSEGLPLGPWTTVDYSKPAVDLMPDVLSSMQNTIIDTEGAIRERNGCSAYIAGAIAGEPNVMAIGSQRFDSTDNNVKFMVAGTSLYEDVSGTWTDRSGSFTADAQTVYANANGTLILATGIGNDAPIKWAASGGNAANLGMGSSLVTSCEYIQYWHNRAWLIGSSVDERYAHYSSNVNIESYGLNDFVLGDAPAVAGIPVNDLFGLFTIDGIYQISPSGNADDPYYINKVANISTTAKMSVIPLQSGGSVFVRKDGIFYWDGAGKPQKISYKLDGNRYWDLIDKDNINVAMSVEVPLENQVWFGLPYGVSQTSVNHWVVWDYARNAWMGPFVGWSAMSVGYFDDLPHMGWNAGIAYKHNTGTNDAGSAIKSSASTSATPPQGLSTDNRWLFARHEFEAQENEYSLTVQQSGPGIPSKTESFEIGDPSDALVTEFTIGVSSIRLGNVAYFIDTDLLGYDPMTMLTYFNNNVDEPWAVRKAELNYRPVGKQGRRKLGVL